MRKITQNGEKFLTTTRKYKDVEARAAWAKTILVQIDDPDRQEYLARFYKFENCMKQNHPYLMDQLEEL